MAGKAAHIYEIHCRLSVMEDDDSGERLIAAQADMSGACPAVVRPILTEFSEDV